MWNSWMENAKAMAADLDTKLNDAVGIDDAGNAIDTPSAATQGTGAPSAFAVLRTPLPPSAAAAVTTTATDADADEDAWNDDFDFGDDDDDDDDMADVQPSEPDPTVVAKSIPAAPVAAIAATPQSSSIPEPKKTDPIVPLATPAAKTPAKLATPKALVTPIIPKTLGASLNAPTSAAVSTTNTKSKPIPTPVISKVEAAPTPVVSAPESATPKPALESAKPAPKPESPIAPPKDDTEDAGWDGDDDLDVDFDDNDEADAPKEETDTTVSPKPPKDSIAKDAKTEEAPAPSSTPTAAPPAAATPTAAATTPASDSGGGMFSNFSTLAQTADSFLTSAVKNPEKQAATAEPDPKRETDAEQDSEKQNTLDPKTTSPLPSPVAPINPDATAAATATAVATPKSSTPASPPKATPKPTAAATPAPKFTPGGSLFSNLTGLAKTADSLLTAAVEQSAGVVIGETSDPIDESGGWEEENDDAFFDDDDDDENNKADVDKPTTPTNVPTGASQEKVKTEESTASFVKVSPTSSISTPEVLPHKASIPQPPKEADTAKEPPGQSSASSPDGKATATPADSKPSAPIPSANVEDDPRFQKLQETLKLREEQLMDKGTQLNELQLLLESRDEQYKKKLSDTKEEAKKRILRAKERCEAAEAKLKARSAGDSEDAKKKQLIIDELMEEGQALAEKQSKMERAVREANAEARGLAEEVRQESQEKEQALHKIQELEAQCKSLKESLASARKGESQAGKLENDLLSARADAEEKANTILSLQQRLKEFTAESKELRQEIDATRKSAAHAAQQEQTSMRKEHNDLIGDLEQKLRTTEREAGVREDALRHEITEIRKRWQDSVRRADALSMDIQSSTAPLLRQLESMERQNRLRVANAAELESRLRSEVEEATIENERLAKESSEFKAKLSKLERSVKDRDQELSKAQSTLEEQAKDLETLRTQEEKLVADAQARQAEYETVERLANEGVARVRSEMSQTVADSEERYRGQIERLQKELATEAEKRTQLEAQVSQLLESGGGLFAAATPAASMNAPHSLGIKRETKPKKLHKAENQASILAGALGLGDDSSDDDSAFESDDDDQLFDTNDDDDDEGSTNPSKSGGGGGYHSFAAIEQLSSKLKTSEVELKSMRKSLKESNELNQSLVEELGEARAAKEKLPLFEAKIKELTQENKQLEQEVAGLKEDIADTKELYGSQLHAILEAQVAATAGTEPTTPAKAAPEPESTPAQDGSANGFDDDW